MRKISLKILLIILGVFVGWFTYSAINRAPSMDSASSQLREVRSDARVLTFVRSQGLTRDVVGLMDRLDQMDSSALRSMIGAMIVSGASDRNSELLFELAFDEWSDRDPWQSLEWILAKGNCARSQKLIAAATRKCSASDLPKLLETLNACSNRAAANTAIQGVLSVVDGSQFSDIFGKIPEGEILENIMAGDVLKKWANSDPEELLKISNQKLDNKAIRQYIEEEVIAQLVKTDLAKACSLAAQDAEESNYGTSRLLVRLLKDCPIEKLGSIETIVKSLPAGPDRTSRLSELAARYAESDVAAAFKFADNLDGFDRAKAIKSIVVKLGTTDDSDLSELLGRLPTGSSSLDATRSIMQQRSRKDPLSAWNSAIEISNPVIRRQALTSVLPAWVSQNPEGSLNQIFTITENREELLDCWVKEMRGVGPRFYESPMAEAVKLLERSDSQNRGAIVDALKRNLSTVEIEELKRNPISKVWIN